MEKLKPTSLIHFFGGRGGETKMDSIQSFLYPWFSSTKNDLTDISKLCNIRKIK